MPARTEIGHLRVLVQLGSNAMTDELPHHAEAVRLDPLLHRRAHVADRIADAHLLNALVQRLFRDLQQFLDLG
jgi:hypothetical protein